MDSPVIKRYRAYPSLHQKLRLIELIQADQELLQGKFSARFTKKEGARRWQAIAEELNKIPGAVKTWIEWRKTWQDKKSRDAKESRREKKELMLKAGRIDSIITPPVKLKTNDSVPETSEPGPSNTEDTELNIEDVFHADTAVKMELESSDSDDPLNFQEEFLLSSDPPTPEPEPEPEIEVPTNPAKSPSRKRYRRVLRRPITQSRLDATNHITVNEVKKALIQKNEIKKKFYAEYMVEIRKQTQALICIANRLTKR